MTVRAVCVFLMCVCLLIPTVQAQIEKSQSQLKQCKVIDPDIANKYVGECKNDHANGYGYASGRDEYRGDFKNGLAHGFGTYSWGPHSRWASEEYQGWYYKGKKMGFGVMTISSKSEHPALESMRKNGTLRYGKYYYSGMFKSGEAIHACGDEVACLDELPTVLFDELDDFVANKEYPLDLNDLKRLTILAFQRESKFSPKVKECIVDELIGNSFPQRDATLRLDAAAITQYQRFLRVKRLVTQTVLYCIE